MNTVDLRRNLTGWCTEWLRAIPKWSTMLVHGLLNHTIGLRHVYYWSLRRDSYCICPLFIHTLVIVVLSSQLPIYPAWLRTFRSSTAPPVQLIVGEKRPRGSTSFCTSTGQSSKTQHQLRCTRLMLTVAYSCTYIRSLLYTMAFCRSNLEWREGGIARPASRSMTRQVSHHGTRRYGHRKNVFVGSHEPE